MRCDCDFNRVNEPDVFSICTHILMIRLTTELARARSTDRIP